jgi:hypothetical protein
MESSSAAPRFGCDLHGELGAHVAAAYRIADREYVAVAIGEKTRVPSHSPR